MTQGNVFELHSYTSLATTSAAATSAASDQEWMTGLPWQDETQPPPGSVIEIANGPVLIGTDETNCPCQVTCEDEAIASFAVVDRQLGSALCMIAHRDDVLVNGIPALGLTVLRPRDAVVVAPGVHTYVTERVRPYVGPALKEHIGKKCPFCRIPISKGTHVVTCRCGVVFHHETEQSHPDIEEADRLSCLSKLHVCLSCSRPVTLEEYLVWDPAHL